jgi:hypothetical protein
VAHPHLELVWETVEEAAVLVAVLGDDRLAVLTVLAWRDRAVVGKRQLLETVADALSLFKQTKPKDSKHLWS